MISFGNILNVSLIPSLVDSDSKEIELKFFGSNGSKAVLLLLLQLITPNNNVESNKFFHLYFSFYLLIVPPPDLFVNTFYIIVKKKGFPYKTENPFFVCFASLRKNS